MRRLSLAFALTACLALAAPAGACPDNCFFTPGGTWTCTSAASAGAINGSLMFLDLPPAASVTSCNGFVQAPTPTRATTWGALKAGYR